MMNPMVTMTIAVLMPQVFTLAYMPIYLYVVPSILDSSSCSPQSDYFRY